MSKIKQLGQVPTPTWIVQEILNATDYTGKRILRRYALEPACGSGQFLCEMVSRYIQAGIDNGLTHQQISDELSEYIIGVEIDKSACDQCINRLNQITKEKLGISSISWRIYHKNTLDFYQNYPRYFDWIVGNPPYVRLHNLNDETRNILKEKFQFTKGTTDLYLAFFEMCFFMLNERGKFGFITPNSFLYNNSYRDFRQFLQNEKKLKLLYDLKSNKVFDGYSTYTSISVFDNSYQNDYFIYKELVNNKFHEINRINYCQLDPKKWIFANKENSEFLSKINNNKQKSLQDYFNIQYGFATLRDKIFIDKAIHQENGLSLFHGTMIETAVLRPVVKGSRYKGSSDDIEHIIFPYVNKNGRYLAYDEQELASNFPLAYDYLLKHKTELLKRDSDKKAQWFEFGRSQGLQTSHQEKIVVSTLVNQQINFFQLPKEVLVYSGIFLTKKDDDVDWQIAKNALSSPEFLHYARLTGKDMSGGYKSLSSKQIKSYGLI
ncbi:MAG: Eco57I restriction-modification methylase domain-containing protein [Moraxella sp.]|uniref:Eco57I restriction-modification methylase domain-containing protein n=1 Tax=Moraxella sp. TaxID=479 RepID=UPI0026DC9286|nr:Eco57I restriction-modification methylase domain-containing protein [Moraxella sp.]MDO4450851.1 Eco57I restriction-modification methylase domain-containing protein [Moraxella sp.]